MQRTVSQREGPTAGTRFARDGSSATAKFSGDGSRIVVMEVAICHRQRESVKPALVIEDINLQIPEQRVTAIIGRNGSGMSSHNPPC